METTLNSFYNCRRMGLKMNIAKTNMMVVDNIPINVSNVLIENVHGYVYARKTTDGPRVSPLGDHMTRKDDKGDQPSGGETTRTNTGHGMAEDSTRHGKLETAC